MNVLKAGFCNFLYENGKMPRFSYLSLTKMRSHIVQERGQILLTILHDQEYAVKTLAYDDLFELDYIAMPQREQQIDLAQAAHRQAVLLFFHAYALESHDLVGCRVPGSIDHAVRALAYLVQLLVLVHISILFRWKIKERIHSTCFHRPFIHIFILATSQAIFIQEMSPSQRLYWYNRR